jgi:NitT/TauT family transport system substrate-binding protein
MRYSLHGSLITCLSVFFAMLIVATIFSCGQRGERHFSDIIVPDDSAQLRIAVMPTLDCLPIYVAEACGIFKDNDLDVSLLPFTAQMDCDTAIQQGHANAIVSDLVRCGRMNDSLMNLEYITATDASWQLLTNRTARLRLLRQLDDKMVAMTRYSATHLLSDLAVDSARLKTERVFRIQVNDVNVRLGMLQAGIMDALLLPEPQATVARNERACLLLDTRDLDYRLGVVAFKKRAATKRQRDAFCKSYDMAVDSLNEQGIDAFVDLIVKRCGVSKETIDSLPRIPFSHTAPPRIADIQRASAWLEKQKNIVEERGLQID